MAIHLPSLDVPAHEKRHFSEADVHSSLFEKDAQALGYPPRDSTEADGAYFQEQRSLALRRLAGKRSTGRYDGLYLIGNSPVMLVEIKRYDAIDADQDFARAKRQIINYALSGDFTSPPPFLFLYCGKTERNVFWRLKQVEDGAPVSASAYEPQPEPWSWQRIRDAHVKGEFSEEIVDRNRLLTILGYHLDRIADDIRPDVHHAVAVVSQEDPPEPLTLFGRWLVDHSEAHSEMRRLYQRKLAEIGARGTSDADKRRVAEEMTVQAALNYLNKVFFLNLCEERNLPGFFRVLRDFLPEARTEVTPTSAIVFMGLLRRKIRDSSRTWDTEDERAYRELREELMPDVGRQVIEQNNWWSLIRVAFDLAEEQFPIVYHPDAYDLFRPKKERLAELIFDLSTKSFVSLDNHAIGDIYQGLMSHKRQQQSRLGAFYTPKSFVQFMVSRLNLNRDAQVLDPCMGSGHFLEGIVEDLIARHAEQGFDAEQAYRTILSEQLYGADIDSFAASLAAIRLFLSQPGTDMVRPNLWVHDMLLHTPDRPASELFNADLFADTGKLVKAPRRAVAMDPDLDRVEQVDEIRFDAVVGNPPYGARKPAYKQRAYGDLYGTSADEIARGSIATGDHDSYGMFFASAIGRLKEGGRLCFVTSDSFRTLHTHRLLRRYILDRCKIIEVLLTDTRRFEGVSFAFAGMAITVLERCDDEAARRNHVMRLVDTVSDPAEFANPPAEKVFQLRQSAYEDLTDTPFCVGVPDEVVASVKHSDRLETVAHSVQGLATADDQYFLAGIDQPFPRLPTTIKRSQLADDDLADDEKTDGITHPVKHWVPFEKGEGFGEYWRPPSVAINWSREAVQTLKERAKWKAGTSKRPRFQNTSHYFKAGLTYSVVTSGRLSFRLMPAGSVFGHKGSAVFLRPDAAVDLRFLLGYLNSALATFLMKKIVNSTATADVGYIGRLPFRVPDIQTHDRVAAEVQAIIDALKKDPQTDVADHRAKIDQDIFDLFDIDHSRDLIVAFYERGGRVESAEDGSGDGDAVNDGEAAEIAAG